MLYLVFLKNVGRCHNTDKNAVKICGQNSLSLIPGPQRTRDTKREYHDPVAFWFPSFVQETNIYLKLCFLNTSTFSLQLLMKFASLLPLEMVLILQYIMLSRECCCCCCCCRYSQYPPVRLP